MVAGPSKGPDRNRPETRRAAGPSPYPGGDWLRLPYTCPASGDPLQWETFSRNCQTSTATPAKPGVLLSGFRNKRYNRSGCCSWAPSSRLESAKMKVTYSQDVIIEDERTLAALAVFCEKVYLPYHGVARDLQTAAHEVHDFLAADIDAALQNDQSWRLIEEWKKKHALLLSQGVVEFLPLHRFKEHRHRHIENTASVELDVYGDTKSRGLTAGLALRNHLIRDDLPGAEFFESGKSAGQVKLARSLFFFELPGFTATDEVLCELRKTAFKCGISDFWKMIDVQANYAGAAYEDYGERSEEIRKQYTKWWQDNLKFRGKSLAVLALSMLCFGSSEFTPVTTLAAADWIGEVNLKWARRKSAENQAFKFISRLDGRIQHLAT